jgi:peptidyl-prolyl cis-trans isomerase B (cyclophilin B)
VSKQRERELARAKYERQSQRRVARAKRVKIITRGVWALIIIAALTFVGVNRNSQDAAAPTESASASTSAAPAAPVVDTCTTAVATRADNITYGSEPTDAKAAKTITLATNCGDIEITTDANAPHTAAIMSYLAQNKFFDATKCHRLTTDGIWVLQCGDPTATGSGGPGFQFADENLPSGTVYKRGTVAMANSGSNTNGSQFFLVYKDSPLPANYSVWGTVTKGLEVLDAVAGAGVAGGGTDGNPAQEVVISTAVTAG